MSWPPHPNDEWVEATRLGDAEPSFILGRSGIDEAVGSARAKYLAGQITAEDFEAAIDAALAEAQA